MKAKEIKSELNFKIKLFVYSLIIVLCSIFFYINTL